MTDRVWEVGELTAQSANMLGFLFGGGYNHEHEARLTVAHRDPVRCEPRNYDDPCFSARSLAFLFGGCLRLRGDAMDWILYDAMVGEEDIGNGSDVFSRATASCSAAMERYGALVHPLHSEP